MILNNYIVCNFIYSFFFSNKNKNKSLLQIKSFIFYLLILNYIFHDDFKLKFKKKKVNKFTILKAPYKNKTAQRSYSIKKFFFKISIIFSKKNNFNILFIKNFLHLNSFFFYNFFVKVRFLI